MARNLSNDQFTITETDLELSIPLDPGVTYTIQPIPYEEAHQIIKQHTKRKPGRNGRMEEEFDQKANHVAMLDRALVGWAGIENNGKPLECTLKYKLELPALIQFALVERAQSGSVASAAVQAQSFRQSP